MHCAGNFVLEFPSISSPILTLTHARVVYCLAAWVILADDKFGGARMRHRKNRRVYARKFQTEITRAMHAGQERSVRRGRGLAASAAPVFTTQLVVVKNCWGDPRPRGGVCASKPWSFSSACKI